VLVLNLFLLFMCSLASCSPSPTSGTHVDENQLSPEMCRLPSQVEVFDTLGKMPAQIQTGMEQLREQFVAGIQRPSIWYRPRAWSRIAARNEPFSFSDALDTGLPLVRFVQGGRRENRWFVWYEHAGFTTEWRIGVFDTVTGNGAVRVLTVSVERPDYEDVCALIDGKLVEAAKRKSPAAPGEDPRRGT
jgi:hypothetical protein